MAATTSSKTIEKKILPQYFEAVVTGEKTFELRLDEDDVQTGDTLILREWNRGKYTGRSVTRKVGFVLRGDLYGLREGWCIISLLAQPVEMRINQYGNNNHVIGYVENLTIE